MKATTELCVDGECSVSQQATTAAAMAEAAEAAEAAMAAAALAAMAAAATAAIEPRSRSQLRGKNKRRFEEMENSDSPCQPTEHGGDFFPLFLFKNKNTHQDGSRVLYA